MPIKITAQKDYLKTEFSVSPSSSVADVDELLRGTKTSGKMIVLYNQGHVQGINVEQNSRLKEGQSDEVRKLIKVATETL